MALREHKKEEELDYFLF